MQTRSKTHVKGLIYKGEYSFLQKPDDLNEDNCHLPNQQYTISTSNKVSSKEYQFCIQNFITNQNHYYLALKFQRCKTVHNSFISSNHCDYRIQIIIMKTNQSVFKGRFWCIDRLTMQFTLDSQFLVYSREDNIGIINIKQKTETILQVKANFFSLDYNNNIYLITDKKNLLIYSLKNNNLSQNISISNLFYRQKLLRVLKINLKLIIVDTMTQSQIINLKNNKILSIQKNTNQYRKFRYIFQNKIIVIPQLIKKNYCIKQLRTGKIIRMVNEFQIYQSNIFENQNSIYLFSYQYRENANEKYKFYLMDLLKGVKKELTLKLDNRFQIKYFPLVMQNNLIIGIDEQGKFIRHFSID